MHETITNIKYDRFNFPRNSTRKVELFKVKLEKAHSHDKNTSTRKYHSRNPRHDRQTNSTLVGNKQKVNINNDKN